MHLALEIEEAIQKFFRGGRLDESLPDGLRYDYKSDPRRAEFAVFRGGEVAYVRIETIAPVSKSMPLGLDAESPFSATFATWTQQEKDELLDFLRTFVVPIIANDGHDSGMRLMLEQRFPSLGLMR